MLVDNVFSATKLKSIFNHKKIIMKKQQRNLSIRTILYRN